MYPNLSVYHRIMSSESSARLVGSLALLRSQNRPSFCRFIMDCCSLISFTRRLPTRLTTRGAAFKLKLAHKALEHPLTPSRRQRSTGLLQRCPLRPSTGSPSRWLLQLCPSLPMVAYHSNQVIHCRNSHRMPKIHRRNLIEDSAACPKLSSEVFYQTQSTKSDVRWNACLRWHLRLCRERRELEWHFVKKASQDLGS